MSGQPSQDAPEQQPPHLHPPPPAPPEQQQQQHPQTEVPSSPTSPTSTATPSAATPSAAAPTVSPPPLLEQARVATVLYDMLLRGGPDTHSLSAQLSAAYPAAAAIARQYAAYSRHAFSFRIPQPHTHPAHGPEVQPHHRRDFVLSRINVASVAWFCFFIGSLLASLRLCFIFSLALAATLAHSADNVVWYEIVDKVAVQTLGEGPRAELYKWIFRVLTEENPVAEFGQGYEWMSSPLLPSYISAALLLTPLTAGILCFLLGALAAISVNFALRAAGGIRFENRDA